MPDIADSYRLDKQQARRAFERAAATYDQAAALQNEVGNRMLERLDLVRLRPARVLDLGAGTGEFSQALRKRYRKASVVSLDIALNMLRHTQNRGGWLHKPVCVCGDGECLPFADDSFELVFSNLMLQWCMDLEPVFTELRRVLAPGGLLMFTTFGPDTLRELRASWEAVDGYTHVNAFIDMHDIGDALIRTHWAEPVMDSEYITVTYPGVRTLMQDLKNLGAHNVTAGRPHGLTGRQRLQQVEQAYEAFRADGVLPASYEVVYGHAWSPVALPATHPVEVSVTRMQPRRPASDG
ncbi:MAG: malonyl-ACP O-methyltransferase BioC [Gammaproteobacteria bacterium]|nr:MAG: malonyl-ACP O-methyltransferase BioC [Gammaproteobacteria bacterium]